MIGADTAISSLLAAPVFLADMDSHGRAITLHVSAGVDGQAVTDRARKALRARGSDLQVNVKRHDHKGLLRPRSIEEWLLRLAPQQVVYDPTLIVARAQALVTFAQAVRVAGSHTRGIFFDWTCRTIVVVADASGRSAAETRLAAEDALARVKLASGSDVLEGVRLQLVDRLQRADLLPIDKRSASASVRIRRALVQLLAPITMTVAAMGLAAPAAATARQMSVPSDSRAMELDVLLGLSPLASADVTRGADALVTEAVRMYFLPRDKAVSVAQLQMQTQTQTQSNQNNQNTANTQSNQTAQNAANSGQTASPGS